LHLTLETANRFYPCRSVALFMQHDFLGLLKFEGV